MNIPKSFWILVVFFLALPSGKVYSYNIDSLITSLGQISFEEQHKKVKTEIESLVKSQVKDATELGNYWINVLNEKKEYRKLADILVATGMASYHNGDYTTTIQYYQTAIKIYKTLNDKKGEAMAIRELGFCYKKMGVGEEAYRYMESSLVLFKETNDTLELATTYNHMGNLIEDWKNELPLAEQLYRKSLYYAEIARFDESISYSLEFIGIIKGKTGQTDSADFYFKKSLDIRKRLGIPFPLAMSYVNLGELSDMKGDYNSAYKYYHQSLKYSNSINFHNLNSYLYGAIGKIHQRWGDLDSALIYMEKGHDLKDSIYNMEKTKEFANVKEKYETQIKEEKIVSLNNTIELDNQKSQKRIYLFTAIIASLGGLILVGIIIVIAFNYRRQKLAAIARIEEERLRNKMIIETEEKERTRIAKDIHDSLGQMLAAVKMNLNSIGSDKNNEEQFKKTTRLLDDTITEMRSISHAMMPESLVKNGLAQALMDISNHVETNQTKVNINVDNWKGWTSTGEYVLYRVVQELLNNTLKHAEAKNVNIELNQFDDEINLIYEDDGKGFDVQSIKSDGIGLKNMQNRLSTINGVIEFDSTPGQGTTAIISVSLKENT